MVSENTTRPSPFLGSDEEMVNETDQIMTPPFWRTKRLDEMNDAEWESLCDGCARCCLNKLEDADTGRVAYTDIACSLLDGASCRCSDYANRLQHVPDCVQLTPAQADEFKWLPPTCAYRLVSEGKDLPLWHHLVCGDPDAVHHERISQSGRMLAEGSVPEDDWEDHLIFRAG